MSMFKKIKSRHCTYLGTTTASGLRVRVRTGCANCEKNGAKGVNLCLECMKPFHDLLAVTKAIGSADVEPAAKRHKTR